MSTIVSALSLLHACVCCCITFAAACCTDVLHGLSAAADSHQRHGGYSGGYALL
jgi:hypothetical protein